MISRISVTALTLTVLGAGAVAFAASEPNRRGDVHSHITNIEKNQAWPFKGNITLNPCANVLCEDV